MCVCVCMARSTMHSVLFDRYSDHQNECDEKKFDFEYQDMFVL